MRRIELRSGGERTVNVFADNCIVNRILDLEESRPDENWEEDRKYLMKLRYGPVASGKIKLFINPSVVSQVEATPDPERRKELMAVAEQFKFIEFNMTIFPFSFPAHFLSTTQKAEIQKLCMQHPALARDEKILADAAFNERIEVLLTTDRDLVGQGAQLGKVRIMLPKQLWDYYTIDG